MANVFGSPTIKNCTFRGNAAVAGGGMANAYNSSPALTNCIFSGNSASGPNGPGGGGMINAYDSHPKLINCTFSGNSASATSGYGGGGMCNAYQCHPTLINCTFSGNTTPDLGGGLFNMENSNPVLTNCIMWGNTAASAPEVHNINSAPTFSYCDIAGSGGSGSWDPLLGTDGTGNIDADPVFVNPAAGDYKLLPGSPCIDAGNNAPVPADVTDLDGDGDTIEPLPIDLAGAPRFSDHDYAADTGAGTAPLVDMGAYERRLADTNGDGLVDVVDLLDVVYSFGYCAGDLLYNPTADFNHEGCVDVVELLDLVYNFGT
jgi:hypothetical protein